MESDSKTDPVRFQSNGSIESDPVAVFTRVYSVGVAGRGRPEGVGERLRSDESHFEGGGKVARFEVLEELMERLKAVFDLRSCNWELVSCRGETDEGREFRVRGCKTTG